MDIIKNTYNLKELLKSKDFIVVLASVFIFLISFKPDLFIYSNKEKTKQQQECDKVLAKAGYNKETIYEFDGIEKQLRIYREIEKAFYSDFENFVKDKKNLKKVRTNLANLKTERTKYREYLKRIKLYKKNSFSYKRRNSLIYYENILDRGVKELKEIERKFNLRLN